MNKAILKSLFASSIIRPAIVLAILLFLLFPVQSAFAGSIVGWGYNYGGQATPPAGNDFVAISAGYQHGLAIRSDGSLAAWGANWYGQTNVPVGNDFVDIAAAHDYSLALRSDGSLVGWGFNVHGQTNVPAGNDFVAIAAGDYDGFAIRSDGSLVSWGWNMNGQTNVPAGNDFVDIAAGYNHAIALRSDGSLVGWGSNAYGQINVPAGNDFVDIAAGYDRGVALRSDGSLVAWGHWFGEEDVPAGNDFVDIAAGGNHGLALRSDGSLAAWGFNNFGQMNVPKGNDFIDISAGGNYSLAIKFKSPPVASFTYSPERPMVGGNLEFDANQSTGDITEYYWDYGDGNSETVSVPKVTHVFETPGIYTVTLTVTDVNGLTNSTSQELNLTLEIGDILLCRTDMSFVPGREWTHIAMYVGKLPIDGYGEVDALVEAVPGVVRKWPLSTWNWPNLTYVRALRVKTDPVTRKKAADFALDQKNKPYDWWSLIFDAKQSKGNMWYCSELVWAAYLNASDGQIDLDEIVNPFYEETITPDEIDLSRWVEMIGEHKEETPETFWFWFRLVGGIAQCPVDLIVRDPMGRTLSKNISEIPNAFYQKIDVDDDNDLDVFFAILRPSAGYYLISVVAEPNATPADTYSLEAKINGQTMVLAQDVQIQNIPSEPYIIESKLNPADFDNDGDVDFYDYAAFASRWMSADCHYPDWCEGKDLDYSGLVDFMDLSIFTENWLWAKIPADIDIDGNVDFFDYAILVNYWMAENCAEHNWCDGADLNKSGEVDIFDLGALAEYWLEGTTP